MNESEPYLALLQDELDDEEVYTLLNAVGFADRESAQRSLGRIARHPQMRAALAGCLPNVLTALEDAADPDRALVDFERFVQSVSNPFELFEYLRRNPRAAELLVTLSQGSQFLTQILLRNPEYFDRLTDRRRLGQVKTPAQFYAEAQQAAPPGKTPARRLTELRRFQRWELLRIGACDFLGLLDLPTVTAQLSHLAESIIRLSLAIAAEEDETPLAGFVIIAMGKLGGEELNYSSDIDLLFLAESDANRFQRLGQRLIGGLASISSNGFLYRVDMRLRPWGRGGPLVSPVDGYLAYLRQHARLWEKQALLKGRVIAGDRAVGHAFLRAAHPLIFEAGHDAVRADVHAMKQRIEAGLRRQGREWGEVKLGEGSIRDIEFVTQYLQLVHGATRPEVRSPTTLDALSRLSSAGLLASDDYRILSDGYVFLRTIEHYLQLMNYRQTHTVPADREALMHLARRLGFEGDDAGDQFRARYEQYTAALRDVYRRHLEEEERTTPRRAIDALPTRLRPHLTRLQPSYLTTFNEEEIARHVELIEQLSDETPVTVETRALDAARWRVTIVGYDALGELSIITGLFLVYGFNIVDGNVFTYEPLEQPQQNDASASDVQQRWRRRLRRSYRSNRRRTESGRGVEEDDSVVAGGRRRKIVDVFTVEPAYEDVSPEIWTAYEDDLTALVRQMLAGKRRTARGELARRVAAEVRAIPGNHTTLYPIDIELDNDAAEDYTVLRLEALDTVGFLYEFTNALAMNRIHIAHVQIDTIGDRVHDVLYVTDAHGEKITSPEKQRELRAATVLVKHFTHLLPQSPNPETALQHFREFLGDLFQRPDWPDELVAVERPEVLSALARLLGVSEFLWEDFLRMQYDNLFPVVRSVTTLDYRRSPSALRKILQAELETVTGYKSRRRVLNAFKDREMFRVDMRYILGQIETFEQFSQELSDLADVTIEAALDLCETELEAQYGPPHSDSGERCTLSILTLGKCGGREMGFASDIELMFVYAGTGTTMGSARISVAEYYENLVATFLDTIKAKREGVFEVDLQLRPYGKAGSLAVSLDAFRTYFAPDGPAWPYERQALVKLRPVAGDAALGEKIVQLRDTFIYDGDPFDVAAMRAMRERQIRHLVTPGTLNAKFSPGGLVDVEYIVQGLQLTHGHRDPRLRSSNTRQAMAALAEMDLLTQEEYLHLRDAHAFLRRLIEALRMVRGNAKDLTVPPADSEEFSYLARRLRYALRASDLAQLRADLTRHMETVEKLSTTLLVPAS